MQFLKKILGLSSKEDDEVNGKEDEIKEVDLEPESELSDELKERITNLLKKGKTKNEIKNSLVILGYDEKEIDDFILSLIKVSKAEDLYALSGRAFEEFLSDLFSHLGYSSVTTKTTGDQGGDIVIKKDDDRIVVQAKNFSGNLVGNKAIQEVLASKSYYGCNKAMVVTTSKFTRPAKDLADKNNIELWDKNKLTELLNQTNFTWLPKESHIKQGTRIKISGTYIENHPFSIRLRNIKVLSNMAETNNITGEQKKVDDLIRVGFEIKNISDKDWVIGSEKSFIVDKSNKQHESIFYNLSNDEDIGFAPYDYHGLYTGCSLNFYLLFHKKDIYQGIQKFILNISYTTPEAYNSGSYSPESKLFKVDAK